ncbi:MAG: C39 family peptidase [Oscillospiraceae bacterium]|nr:C39 family peptidase [Oscillospiraceae bacterium]
MNASLTIQPARRISTRQALRAAPPRPVYQAPDRARRQRAARRQHRVAAAALLALLAFFGGLRDAAGLFAPSAAGGPEKSPVLEVPALSQTDWPTGCESVSAVMALNWAGADLTVEDFVYGFLPMDELWMDAAGQLCGPSPADTFIGDPAGRGYGCFAPVLARAMSRAAPAGYRALDLTGSPLSELACAYLRHNIPVVIWATMEMRPVEAGTQWLLPGGEVFTWPSGEHCLLLVGETAEGYLLNDPRAGETVCYDKELVRRRYESLGSQAVALVPVR